MGSNHEQNRGQKSRDTLPWKDLPTEEFEFIDFANLSDLVIEEGCRQKQRRSSSQLFGGQILFNSLPCYSCFASVDFEEKVEFIQFFLIDRDKIASAAKRNWIYSAPQTDEMIFAFASISFLLLWILFTPIDQSNKYADDMHGGAGGVPSLYKLQ